MSKTNLEEINRNIYDIKNKDEYDFKIKTGLTPEIIEEISKQKNAPEIHSPRILQIEEKASLPL